MSSSIDERVLSMKFDNQNFENNVGTTMGSLDKLKKSLALDGAAKGLDEVSRAGQSLNSSHLSGIAATLDTIANKFSTMGIIAFSVLNNIINRVVDTGIALAKNLSLGQIISGFKEYETNINSIQTILANTDSKGSTLKDVSDALDVLNEYSDQTIYNFSEMTRNIGTFTAAGIDLDTSVSAIKGIANLAAISGSNSQQASTAMYQLSQALASGTVKLMDWNSVVNAGMGGEVFQKALFETGKSLGTIKDVPLTQTFEQWKEAGNSFRGSLEQGWITSEVLTNTLQGFTGDLTDAQLKALGYTEEQIVQIQRMGQVGKDAATKVKTFSQLMSTTREAIGSGWSQSFRTIIGDFEQAREMFTGFSNSISEVVKKNAEARNELLGDWAALGGRLVLIQGIKLAFEALGRIITVVKDAFHDVFPKATGRQLMDITSNFRNFMRSLVITGDTAKKLRKIFAGVFSIVRIGIEVVSQIASVFIDLFKSLTKNVDGSGVLDFFVRLADNIVYFKDTLIASNGIADFINNRIVTPIKNFMSAIDFKSIIDKAITLFKDFTTAIQNFTSGLSFGNVIDRIKTLFSNLRSSVETAIPPEVTDRVKSRLDSISGAFRKFGDALEWVWEKLKKAKDVFKKVLEEIKDIFGEIPMAIANAFSNVQYDDALDTVNTGLFAGLILMLKKFFNNPFKINKGFFDNINKTLEALTGKLQAMQTEIKANAILKIAIALAVLAVSILLFATMDSAALSKAMVAISVSLGVLVGAMALMNKAVSGPKDAAKLAAVATGMLLLSTAMLAMAGAAKIFATMSWEELARGLGGVIIMLGALVGAMKLMSGSGLSSIASGVGIMAVAIALNILAGAVKLFAMMSWEELIRGFSAIAAGLLIMAGAMQLMPNGVNLALQGAGLLQIAIALNILAGAVKIFATMSLEELVKGLGGIAAGLLLIAGAMHLMPNGVSLTLQGAGLIIIATSLVIMAGAIKLMAMLSWADMIRGLTGVAATLLILAGAAAIMKSNMTGAITIGIMAISLIGLATALKMFATMSWGEFGKGLGLLAAALATLALAALAIEPAIVPIFLLAAALGALAVVALIFGVAADLIATAFAVLATSGAQGVETLLGALTVLTQALPGILEALGDALIKFIKKFIDALPEMISGLSEALGALIQLIIDNIPKFGEAFVELIHTMLASLRETFPDILATGFELLMKLLQGIRDNIGEITTVVVDIILNFLAALTARMPEIVAAGLGLLVSFLQGIADNIHLVVEAVANLIIAFITALGEQALNIVAAGLKVLTDFLSGIANNVVNVIATVATIITEFISAVGGESLRIVAAGLQALVDFLSGITENIGQVINAVYTLITQILTEIVNNTSRVITAAMNLLIEFLNGLTSHIDLVITAATNLVISLMNSISAAALRLVEAAFNVVIEFLNGLASAIDNNAAELRAAGARLVGAVINGMTFGLAGKIGDVAGSIVGGIKSIGGGIKKLFGSPAKFFCEIGEEMMIGLANGVELRTDRAVKASEKSGNNVIQRFQHALGKTSDIFHSISDQAPTITPVLDLTKFKKDASSMSDLMPKSKKMSFGLTGRIEASLISKSEKINRTPTDSDKQTIQQITFEQNNYSPKALNHSAIYRQTKNQIAFAKGELVKR